MIKLALVSSGLGNTNRGFEISTARWFDALKSRKNLHVRLFAGGGYPDATTLWNFPRQSIWTTPWQFLPFCPEQRRWEMCYGTEQISFWSHLNFHLIGWKPDVVWVKDIPLAHLLLASRVAFGLKYKLIFGHGGMLRPQTYKDFDVIQQISTLDMEEAIAYGIAPERLELISNCVPVVPPTRKRTETRASLGIQDDDFVVISVAAWNRYHKRIDYLIEEVAAMNDPKVKLLICGAPEVDSEELKSLAHRLLPNQVLWLTVAPSAVPDLLAASDVFVLASLRESLGNALVEAIVSGLPVIAHPQHGAKFAIQDQSAQSYWLRDLSVKGNLTQRLREFRTGAIDTAILDQLRIEVCDRFNPNALADQFERMIHRSLSLAPLSKPALSK